MRIVVYNDGPELDSEVIKGMDVRLGDHLPSESTKYLRFIVDNYDCLSPITVFAQADPFEHSPDFIGLLSSADHYRLPCQPLTYRGHSYPWGPQARLEAEAWPDKHVNGYRVWWEEMDDSFQGYTFEDPFISEFVHPKYWDVDKGAPQPFGVSSLWSFLGIQKPLPDRFYKAYGAIFAVSRHGIQRHPKETYQRIIEWLNVTDKETNKARAIAIEYMFCNIFGWGA